MLTPSYVCPHHPKSPDPAQRECHCRKPKPGLIIRAAYDLNLDLAESVLIGDQPSDISAAVSAGIPEERALLVEEGSTTDFARLIYECWAVDRP